MGIFDNVIECRIDPHSFHFRRGNKSIEVATYLHISTGDIPTILSVGTDCAGSMKSRRVNLFEPSRDSILESKGEFLNAFIKYSINTFMTRSVIVRPTVIFQNSTSLQEYLSGYQEAVLTNAAQLAGARKVIFK